VLTKIRNTVKHSAIYSLGNLSTKLIGLILLPLFTTYLSTVEYGVLAIFETTSLLLLTVFSLNISNAMIRWWADSDSEKEKKSYIFTSFSFIFVILILLNILLQPFTENFALLFYQNADFKIYFNILFLSVAFEIFNRFINSLIRILEKSVLFIIVNSFKLIVSLTLNIYFIVVLRLGVEGIMLAQLIAHIMGFILLLPLLSKHIIFVFKTSELGKMLNYSIPLAFTAIAGVLFSIGDRYVLKYLMGDAKVGIYSLAYKIVGFLSFFVLQSFQMAFLPMAYKMYKEPNAKRFFSKILTYLIIVLTFGGLGLSLFATEFVKIFAPSNAEYWEASIYVSLITVVIISFGIRYMFELNFHLSKKTKLLPIFVSSIAVFNIGLNFALIPFMGIAGAIVSSIISAVILNILYYYFGKKYYFVKYEITKVLIIIAVGISLFLISLIFMNMNLWLNIGLKTIILTLFPIIILLGGFLEPIEKERLMQAWQKWKNPKLWKENIRKLSKKEK